MEIINNLAKLKITSNTVLKRNRDQVFSEIDDEVIMLSIINGEYYSLDSIGSYIWHLLNEPCTFENLINTLLREYEVNEKTCESDTKQFIQEFLEKGIIQIRND